MIRSIIKSSQDLVRAEGMRMMVRMSLYSEKNRRGDRVPRVHLVYRLVDPILVLFPDDSVVLNVVYQLQKPYSHNRVSKLIFQG